MHITLVNVNTLALGNTKKKHKHTHQAEAIECAQDNDCGFKDKICHENKCICARERPIEDQDRCLSRKCNSICRTNSERKTEWENIYVTVRHTGSKFFCFVAWKLVWACCCCCFLFLSFFRSVFIFFHIFSLELTWSSESSSTCWLGSALCTPSF